MLNILTIDEQQFFQQACVAKFTTLWEFYLFNYYSQLMNNKLSGNLVWPYSFKTL